MDEYSGLRTAAVIVVWLTVGGGLILGLTYGGFGGFRAIGPDTVPGTGGPQRSDRPRRSTSFTGAQVVVHATLGILTAVLVTYGATLRDDRTSGYVALIVALLLTAIPGVHMFRAWRSSAAQRRARTDDRAEDHLPKPIVYLHGLGALATLVITVVLLVVD